MTTDQVQIQRTYYEGFEDSLVELQKRLAIKRQTETAQLGEIVHNTLSDLMAPLDFRQLSGE